MATNKFRFQGSSALLTYKTHLNKEEYIEWFKDLVEVPVTDIVLAHETGDKTDPYEHTHVVFACKTAFETKNPRFFDYPSDNCEDIHPHIKKFINKAKPLRDALMYVCKEDPDNADLLQKLQLEVPVLNPGDITKKVWACNTLQDAMLLCEKPSDAPGIRVIWEAKFKTIAIDPEDIPSQPWQNDFIAEFTPAPNAAQRRKIVWFCDPTGGIGKTILTRYMAIKNPHHWRAAGDLGTVRDAATTVKGWLDSGWNAHGVIVDLPRQVAKHDNRIYAYLEAIKNGMMSAQKYAGSTIYFPKPFLIVFANWEPKYTAISKSMWDCRILKYDKAHKMIVSENVDINKAYLECKMKHQKQFDIDSDEE